MASKNPEFQAPLPGGKRFVRYRVLSSPEVSSLSEAASRAVFARLGQESTLNDVRRAELNRFLAAFVVAVAPAEETTIASESEKSKARTIVKPGKWERLNAMDLETEGGPKSIPAIFSAKEVQFLEMLYKREHEVAQQELDALLGKVEPATGD